MRTARRAALRLIRLMMIASLALPAALLVYLAWANHRSAALNADQHIDRYLDVLHEHSLKVLQAAELIMDEVAEMTADLSDAQIRENEAALHQRLAAMADQLSQIHSIWVFDRDGYALLSNYILPAPRDVPLRDREYFSAQEASPVEPFVGTVLIPRFSDAESFFSLSRRRHTADGSFNGVITASLLPSDFERFYADLAREPGSYFALVREDGAILARMPVPADRDHRVDLRTTLVDGLAQSGPSRGLFTATAPTDGIERRFGYRRLSGYPIYLLAGVDVAAIRGAWLSAMAGHLLFAVPASLLLFGTLAIALHRTRKLYEEADRREAAEAALRQSQRLEAIGQLTGGIAHDFNNLLTVIAGNVDRMRRRARDAQDSRTLDIISMAAERGEKLTRQLLAFSRRQALAPEPIDLGALIPRMEEMLRRSLRGDIRVSILVPEARCVAKVDPNELELALINLAVNARDAMPDGGEMSISVRHVELMEDAAVDGKSGRFCALSVTDNGVGIAPDLMPRVFEPFFTTKDVGKGTGLGLSQVYGFARQSGGGVAIESMVGAGTTVTMYLPVSDEAPAPRQTVAPAADAAGTGLRVLIVEDDGDVAEVAGSYFDQLGLQTETAATPQRALERLRSGETFDLLFSDILMPGGMSGLDLAQEVRGLRPEMPVILATGYSSSAERAIKAGFLVIRKPYDAAALAQALGEVRPAVPRKAQTESTPTDRAGAGT